MSNDLTKCISVTRSIESCFGFCIVRFLQAMGLMALPGNVPGSLRNLNQLCDDIWYYAGDRSVNVRSAAFH